MADRDSLREVDLARAEVFRTNAKIALLQLAAAQLDLAEKRDQYEREHAQNFYHHVFVMSGEICGSTVSEAMSTLGVWSRLDGDTPKPIEIKFHSPGGGVLAGMALFDFIRELEQHGHHITTTVMGYAASMAGILIQAGTHRVMGRESYLLIHEIAGIALGKVGEIEDTAEFMRKMQDRVIDIFLMRAEGKISRTNFIKHWKRKDWWLSSQECLKWGFVDEVR